MRLFTWLEMNEISKEEFAKIIGKDKSLVHKYLHEGTKPRDDTMIAIYLATNGLVDANAFYNINERLLEEAWLAKKKKTLITPKIDFKY